MGFAISGQRDGRGWATHRQDATDALACARTRAEDGWTGVRVSTELGESFTPEAFAAALKTGRFAGPD